ncbi:MAG TPA: hypothetical protein V6D00_03775 [Pantanalinema sp.]
MADDPNQKAGFFNQLLSTLGLKKPEPEPVSPPARARTGNTGAIARKPGTGEQFARSRTGPVGAEPSPEKKAVTAPLSPEEKAKQSDERRYLIAAFESTPTLIPEFQNPQYMYKLISNEREYTQEKLNALLEERKMLLIAQGGQPGHDQQERLDALEAQAQDLRNDLTRLFLLIKRVAGIQKSGTGGTDFLDPLKS